MLEFGPYLRKIRNEMDLSLKDVCRTAGISDAKLSKIERGENKPLSAAELKKLAELYHVDLITMFLKAGFLDESDLQPYQTGFQNAGLLTAEEKECVQSMVNLLTKGRKEH